MEHTRELNSHFDLQSRNLDKSSSAVVENPEISRSVMKVVESKYRNSRSMLSGEKISVNAEQ